MGTWERETIKKFKELSNENVMDGHVTIEDVAKIIRILLFAKVYPENVPGIRVGIAIYEKFHRRGIQKKLRAAKFGR